MFELKQICELLVRASGISTGLWELTFEYRVGFGSVAPPDAPPLPSTIVGIGRIGVSPAKAPGPYTVNAAELPPSDHQTLVEA
jgi:hypothetical protein